MNFSNLNIGAKDLKLDTIHEPIAIFTSNNQNTKDFVYIIDNNYKYWLKIDNELLIKTDNISNNIINHDKYIAFILYVVIEYLNKICNNKQINDENANNDTATVGIIDAIKKK